MDTDVEPFRLVEYGLERAWAFGARNLDAILRAVRKALVRGRQLVQIPAGQADRLEELARALHFRRA